MSVFTEDDRAMLGAVSAILPLVQADIRDIKTRLAEPTVCPTDCATKLENHDGRIQSLEGSRRLTVGAMVTIACGVILAVFNAVWKSLTATAIK